MPFYYAHYICANNKQIKIKKKMFFSGYNLAFLVFYANHNTVPINKNGKKFNAKYCDLSTLILIILKIRKISFFIQPVIYSKIEGNKNCFLRCISYALLELKYNIMKFEVK